MTHSSDLQSSISKLESLNKVDVFLPKKDQSCKQSYVKLNNKLFSTRFPSVLNLSEANPSGTMFTASLRSSRNSLHPLSFVLELFFHFKLRCSALLSRAEMQ